MNRDSYDLVDSAWVKGLRADWPLLHASGVHVVAGDLGLNDAMSFMLGETCIFLVAEDDVTRTQQHLSGLDATTAFTETTLRELLGEGARVDGPSLHMYVDQDHFTGTSDPSAACIGEPSPELIDFLRSNDRGDWAESGFPEHPEIDDSGACYWLLREEGRAVAAGNMTEWRGRPSDVGVLTSASERGRGLAQRLVGAMVDAALQSDRRFVLPAEGTRSMLFRFALDQGDGLGGYAISLDGRDFAPGSEHRATIEFWADDYAREIVNDGGSFTVWYGDDVGDGRVVSIR